MPSTGEPTVQSQKLKTKDNVDLVGPSQPLVPLNHSSEFKTKLKPDSSLNKTSLIVQDPSETKDAMVD